jgi:protein-S-isoprenylcysteine O-methyltransferase Ste14
LNSTFFVFVQFLCLGLIALTGPLFPRNLLLLAVELLGFGLGAWAVLVMGIGRFNITPEPLEDSRLVTRGPYRLIRHPMYLALLLVTLPLVITAFTPFRLATWLALLVDLLLKLNYEERLLAEKLVGYPDYMRRSFRLLPYLY